jgi:uncharacterized Zn finger protein
MSYYRKRNSMWAPYVPVADRRRQTERHVSKMKKKGVALNPVVIDGRTIAKSFWGKAWCNNLESYSDFENRLPRGRTYVRNGSVIDLQIRKGRIEAQVMGSHVYMIEIDIRPMKPEKWEELALLCSGQIDSLIELLQGKFSKSVMGLLTEKENGLFPKPHEIAMTCSCPDSAGMCKHIAAALYGVGAWLDEKPEFLFLLRHVDHLDLLASTQTVELAVQNSSSAGGFAESDLSSLFGIEIEGEKKTEAPTSAPLKKKKAKGKATKKKR